MVLFRKCLLLMALSLSIILSSCGVTQPVTLSTQAEVSAYAGEGGLNVSAASAVLYEVESGRVLFAHHCDERLPMASTTKIITAVIAIECGDLDKETVIKSEATKIEGSSVYLTEGERFTQRELLYALLLESGNDAAVALAQAVAGTIEDFVVLMNKKAESLGLVNTRFANPHGLSSDNHYTTAKELAVITAYALQLEEFTKAVSTVSIRLEGDGHLPRYLVNHNKLLRSYDGLIGVKTGYTLASGRCLVTAAKRNKMTLVAVTLNDRNDWKDHTAMLNYGFSAFRMEMVYESNCKAAVPINGGEKMSLTASNSDSYFVCTPTDNCISKLYVTKAVNAPIVKGQEIALLKVFENDTLIMEIPLFADDGTKAR